MGINVFALIRARDLNDRSRGTYSLSLAPNSSFFVIFIDTHLVFVL